MADQELVDFDNDTTKQLSDLDSKKVRMRPLEVNPRAAFLAYFGSGGIVFLCFGWPDYVGGSTASV